MSMVKGNFPVGNLQDTHWLGKGNVGGDFLNIFTQLCLFFFNLQLEVYTYAKVTLLTHMKTLWTKGFFPFGEIYYFDSKGDFFLQMCDVANAAPGTYF